MFASLSLGLAVAAVGVPSKMRAVQVGEFGCKGPDWKCLSVKTDIDTPVPAKDQVLIQVGGSSMNPVNVDMVEIPCRLLPAPYGCPKGLIGNDAAGTVVQVGESCTRIKVGDAVWGSAQGAYADYALMNCNGTGLRPAGLSAIDAGTVPVVGVTGLECLRAAGAPWTQKNITVAITSGSGGTGYIGIQLAKALGATRVVTAASGAGIDLVKALGADLVIDYKTQEIFDALPDNSVDVVYDNYGYPGTADKAMHAIRPGGVFLVLEGGNKGKISPSPKAGVRQVSFGLADLSGHEQLDTLAGMFADGKLKPHTEASYGLAQIRQAFNESKSGQVLGKVSVNPQN